MFLEAVRVNSLEKLEIKMNYLLYKPKEYGTAEKLPMIVFLHGLGEAGEDLELVKVHGVLKVAEERDDFPFVVIAPQCPKDTSWSLELHKLERIIEDAIEELNVDPDRVYLTGLSMGGFGTWNLAMKRPDLFAAIIPICGGTMNWFMLNRIKDTPVWAFHGSEDNRVPVEMSLSVVEKLKEIGGNAKLTVYNGVRHDSWTRTYDNPEIYEWLLNHRNTRNNEL